MFIVLQILPSVQKHVEQELHLEEEGEEVEAVLWTRIAWGGALPVKSMKLPV